MDGPNILPDAAPNLHQLDRSQPARGCCGRRLYDGRQGKGGRQFKEDDMTKQAKKLPDPLSHKSEV